MAEYLSPGVYVEEFDSGANPMEGVGTSTAGFVGLAERGPIEGVPQLITNIADRNMLTYIVVCADVLCFASSLVGLHNYYKNNRFIH